MKNMIQADLGSETDSSTYKETRLRGAQLEGDQLAALLQAIKEDLGLADRIEFTPAITAGTLTNFIERILNSESVKKIQFGVMNVASYGDSSKSASSIEQKLSQVQPEQMFGEHWVSYIQVPKLFDEHENVLSVKAIILNSAGDNYAPALNGLKNRIEEIFAQHKSHNIQIELSVQHLNYQIRDFNTHGDWDTCGIWTCHFFEQTIKKFAKAANPAVVSFNELISDVSIDISHKREEYTQWLKVIDSSTDPIRRISDKIESILVSLADDPSIDVLVVDIDKENSPDQVLAPVLGLEVSKVLIEQIKEKAYPPILDEETEQSRNIRLAELSQSFVDLADLYLQEIRNYINDDHELIKQTTLQYYTEVTKLLNYALSISQDITDKTVLFSEARIEQRYHGIESTLEQIHIDLIKLVDGDISKVKTTSAMKNARLDKEYFTNLRRTAEAALTLVNNFSDEVKITKSRKLFEHITHQVRSYLAMLYRESEEILGRPPCPYTVIGLGSMALRQMTPYSDLEFAILIQDQIPILQELGTEDYEIKGIEYNEKNKKYFRDLTHLVNFRVINLGETVIHEKNIGGAMIYDLVHRGINLDLGGKTPLVISDKPELIQTVDGMLHYVRNKNNDLKWLDSSYILESTCMVYGNTDLYDAYQRGIDQFLFHEENEDGMLNCQARAFIRLREGAIEKELFNGEKSRIGNLKEFSLLEIGKGYEGKLFNAKQEIYRLPDRLLYNLALLYGIQPNSAWDAIDQLQAKSIIGITETSKTAGLHLGYAITFATNLRLRAYLENHGQREDVHIFDTSKLLNDKEEQNKQRQYLSKTTCLSEKDLSEKGGLFKFYHTMLALHYQLENLSEQKFISNNYFDKVSFFRPSIDIEGLIYYRLGMYNQAMIYLEQALNESGNSNIIIVSNALGEIYSQLEDYDKAIKYYTQGLELARLTSHNSLDIAYYLSKLGQAHRNKKNFDEAIKCHMKSLEMRMVICKGVLHPSIIGSLDDIGGTYYDKEEFDEAIHYYTQSLKVAKLVYKNSDPIIAFSLDSLAWVYAKKDLFDNAIKYYMQSLEIRKSFYKNFASIDIAFSFENLGRVYNDQGEFDSALNYYTQGLKIRKIIYKNSACSGIAVGINNIAAVYRRKGDFGNAIKYYIQSFEMRKLIYKNFAHSDIAASLEKLGSIYQDKGDFDQAIQYYTQGLDMRQMICKNCPDRGVVIFLDEIGSVYKDKKEFDKAISYRIKSLEMTKLIYKESTHSEISDALYNLAITYDEQKNYDQAIKYHVESLEMRKSIYKNTVHSKIADSFNGLGNTYAAIEDFDEAIKYHMQSMEMKRAIYGFSDHSSVACSLLNLGNMYINKGECDHAIKLLMQSLEMYKRIYSSNLHEDIGRTLINLGQAYFAKSDFGTAILHYKQSTYVYKHIYKKLLHPKLADLLNDLGTIYKKQKFFDKAIKYYLNALEIRKNIYSGLLHPSIAESFNLLGIIHGDLGRFDKAIQYHLDALEVRRNIYKDDSHLDIADSFNLLGTAYCMKKDNDEAIKYFIMSLEIRNALYKGIAHIDIASSLNNLGNAYHNQRNFDEAIKYYMQSLAIKEIFYKNSARPEIASSLCNIGNTFALKEDLSSAIQYHSRGIDMLKIIHKGTTHSQIADSLGKLGVCYYLSKEFDQAIKCYEQSLEIRKAIYNNIEDSDTALTLSSLGSAYSGKKDFDKALTHCSKALKIITNFPNHSYQKFILNSLKDTSILFAKYYNLDPQEVKEAVIDYAYQGDNFADYILHHDLAFQYYQNNQLEETIEEYRLALIFCPEEKREVKISIHHNLACMYHVAAAKAKESGNIELATKYYQKAEESFKQALDCSEGSISAGLNTEYANFLVQNQKSEEAIAYLKQVIMSTTDSGNGLNYGQMEKVTIDEDLQKEIDFSGEITINNPAIFAYYLLIKIQITLGRLEQANELTREFKYKIENLPTSIAFSLLAYSYKNLARFEEAALAFEQAVNLYQGTEDRPEYTLAIESHAICLSMSTLSVSLDQNLNLINAEGKIAIKELPFLQEEQTWSKILREAQIEKETDKQVDAVCQLAEVYMKRAQLELLENKNVAMLDFNRAAGLYNYAINLIKPQVNAELESLGQTRLKELKTKLYDLVSIFYQALDLNFLHNENDFKAQLVNNKDDFISIRNFCKEKLNLLDAVPFPEVRSVEENTWIKEMQNIYQESNLRLRTNTANIINQCIQELERSGKNLPCKYAVIGLGSIAREEMTPYSDLEWAILVESEKNEDKQYFRNLTYLFQLKTINLGETILPSLAIKSLNDFSSNDPLANWFYDNVTPRGIAFDGLMPKACKWPLGNQHLNIAENKKYELIHTPEEMFKLQFSNDKSEHLTDILTNYVFITGEPELYQNYDNSINKFLHCKMFAETTDDVSIAQYRALNNLKQNIEKYDLKLGEYSEEGKLYDVKQEIYRSPEVIIENLCRYYDINTGSTWDKLTQLQQKYGANGDNTISDIAIQNLVMVASISTWLRLRSYNQQEGQRENLALYKQVPAIGFGNEEIQHIISVPSTGSLFRYYFTVLPLREKLEKLLIQSKTYQTSELLNKDITLFDDGLRNQGFIYKRMYNLQEAARCFKEIANQNDNDDEIFMALSSALSSLNQFEEARTYYDKALAIRIAKYGERSIQVAKVKFNIGEIWLFDENYELAKQEIPITDIIKEISTSYEALNEFSPHIILALKYYKEVSQILQSLKTSNDKNILIDSANLYHGLGIAFSKAGLLSDAKLYLEKALSIYKETGNNQLYAITLNNVANTIEMRNPEQAIDKRKKSYKVLVNHYGNFHPKIANSLFHFGISYYDAKNYQSSIEYFNLAFKQYEEFFPGKHFAFQIAYCKLAEAYYYIGDLSKAGQYYTKAKIIASELEGNKNTKALLLLYHKLANIAFKTNDYREASEFYQKHFSLNKELLGEVELEYVKIYQQEFQMKILNLKLQLLHKESIDFQLEKNKIIDNYKENIDKFFNLAEACYSYSFALAQVGQYGLAWEYYTKAFIVLHYLPKDRSIVRDLNIKVLQLKALIPNEYQDRESTYELEPTNLKIFDSTYKNIKNLLSEIQESLRKRHSNFDFERESTFPELKGDLELELTADPNIQKIDNQDVEVRYANPTYDNPLFNNHQVGVILSTAQSHGGIEAVNRIINLGNNQDFYTALLEGIERENIEIVVKKILSSANVAFLNAIPNDQVKISQLSIDDINNRLLDQAKSIPNNDFINDNYASTTQTNTEANQDNTLDLQALTVGSFAIKEMIEAGPNIKYFAKEILGVQYVIPKYLQEIELSEFVKQNYLWIGVHYAAGTVGAFTLPANNIGLVIKIAAPVASTIIYGSRLAIHDVLAQQKQIDIHNAESKTINNINEFVEKCSLDMTAYSALSFVNGGINKVMLGIPLSMVAYDMLISATLGGIQCYSAYQQINHKENPLSKTTIENILPSVADAMILYTTTQNMHFDFSSIFTSMLSIKQGLAVVSSVVITDQMTKLLLSANRETINDIEKSYVELAFNYIAEHSNNIFNGMRTIFAGEQGDNNEL